MPVNDNGMPAKSYPSLRILINIVTPLSLTALTQRVHIGHAT